MNRRLIRAIRATIVIGRAIAKHANEYVDKLPTDDGSKLKKRKKCAGDNKSETSIND